MDQKKRIAIYGGTFDPVHLGHLEIARRVIELFEIDELLFVPARRAPHKLECRTASPVHRYGMLALATQEDRAIFISTFELDAPNRRYTVDTLSHFRSKYGESFDLFFMMGADSWSEITTWRAWQHLMTMVNHIVVTRPGYDLNLDHVTASVTTQIVDLRAADKSSVLRKVNETLAAGTPGIFITDAVMIDVSASEIRRAAREERGETLKKSVPPSVAEYICKYKLYRNSNEA